MAILAPHRCYGCNVTDNVLCQACQDSVVNNDEIHCYRCHLPTADQALCIVCRPQSPLAGLFVAGSHRDVLERTLYAYKVERVQAAHLPLAELLDAALPHFDDVLITGLPTVRARIRQRGYDQVALLAAALAAQRGLVYRPLLERLHTHRQLGASRQLRLKQAQTAYRSLPNINIEGCTIVLVDDITTTGASLAAGAEQLHAAGAGAVFGLAVAQQPLS